MEWVKMLPSIQPPVVPLPTEIPGLLQFAWTVRFAELKGLGNPLAKAKKQLSPNISSLAWCLDTAVQQRSVGRSDQGWLQAPLQEKPQER